MPDQKPHEYSLDAIDEKLHHFQNELIVDALKHIDAARARVAENPGEFYELFPLRSILSTLAEVRQFQQTIRDARGFQWSPRVDPE